MMRQDAIIVIGGVAAGMSAAAKAARVKPGVPVTVFTDEDYISYGACGLPYYISGNIKSEQSLIARSVEQFKAQGVNVRTGCEVTKIIPETKAVLVRDRQNNVFEERWDKLVIATGAIPFVPPVEGSTLENVFVIRNMSQGIAVRDSVKTRNFRNAVIIGGGYIGLEMAEAFLEAGCKVTIIEMAAEIIPNMDTDMARIVKEYLVSKGVEVYTGERLTGLAGSAGVEKVITDKRTVPADCVLQAVGVVPNSHLAKDCGIRIGEKNAILVNSRMETSMADVYAAGDCATVRHLLTGQDTYIPLGTTANKQGKVAGENAAGGSSSFGGVLGTGIAKVLDMEIARTGLSRREIEAAGLQHVETVIKSRTAAGYYPVSGQIVIKLAAEKDSGRLLGAQIVGAPGAGKRIDVFASCLHLGAAVEDLQDMDLAYAPPFSPVYDAILVALSELNKKVKQG